ncbi:MAG: type I-U CRISPR-associated helicase/endonuclease Cas3 [Phycisphaerae bacterium]|nr:MAG: type I-U CRISPR-associated helicase/endonuclease Cas3 [Phycisphaerae bacterium]
MLESDSFESLFEKLTGFQPQCWQKRLYHKYFLSELPRVIDLPTGLGKTMIMAIWLIARIMHPEKIPTRLIYVVDRRTVVDQATDLAIKLKDGVKSVFKTDTNLAVSTLRGERADNREWSRNPTQSAIIIGTVDLIGSALLFSGYRSSYKRRPLEAGLLGMDSLLVLDEAHLSKPFEKLLNSIETFQTHTPRYGSVTGIKPMRVIRMSATTSNDDPSQFILEEEDLNDKITRKCFVAKKTLSRIIELGEKEKLSEKLAREAIQLAKDADLKGKRIVVFVRKPEDAIKISEIIKQHESRGKNPGPYASSVEVLTGTMRGLERDELITKSVFQRFLDGSEKPGDKDNQPVFLVSTSAGEVGIDLNADHMVCDATTLDSFIQRLGRVNRRGDGEAKIILIKPKTFSEKTDVDKAVAKCVSLLTEGISLSPESIATLKNADWKDTYTFACSPQPDISELTDILLDNWSMTSIVEPMPGRPEVGPWLRGVQDELPQTTVAWRAELDLPGFADLELEDVEEWFDAHRILTRETLSNRSDRVAEVLVERWQKLQKTLAPDQLEKLRQAAVVLDRAGLQLMTVEKFIGLITDKNWKASDGPIRYAELVLPASFGGIERGEGFLDANAPNISNAEQNELTDQSKQAPDVADVSGRYRETIKTNEDGESESTPLTPDGAKPQRSARFTLILESTEDQTIKLVSYVPQAEREEVGLEPQTLNDHVSKVRQTVDSMLQTLPLSDEIKCAVRLAADYHDHGKNRDRWQRLLTFPSGFNRPDQPMAKSGAEMKKDPRGYRHEFGSLREFTQAMQEGKLLDPTGQVISQDVFDLAMHLIAVHHGRGRPHFPKGAFDPDAEDRSEEIHTQAICRFARLQRKYGWWGLAWLENLLRCADAMASTPEEIDYSQSSADTAGINPEAPGLSNEFSEEASV